MKVLCIYITRQIDSNLMMGSTVFNGLSKCGYHVDMLFSGYSDTCSVFQKKYSKYFNHTFYFPFKQTFLSKRVEKIGTLKILYNFYESFLKDFWIRPYNKKIIISKMEGREYDVVLSFIPLSLAGLMAKDIKGVFPNARYIQFWTDPLSLGKCNDIKDIPFYRYIHIRNEKELLSYADKALFCYPLLCDMEKKLHPEFKEKIGWSDVSYIERFPTNENMKVKDRKYKYKIGLFGSYNSSVRNIKPLLEATKKIPNVLFVIRGDSDIKISKEEYPNIDVKEGRCSLNEVENLEGQCDILLVLGNIGGIQIPGKVYYYVNYNKPLICICDSVNAKALKDYLMPLNRYILCDNNTISIEHGILRALNNIHDFKLTIHERLMPQNVARNIIEG